MCNLDTCPSCSLACLLCEVCRAAEEELILPVGPVSSGANRADGRPPLTKTPTPVFQLDDPRWLLQESSPLGLNQIQSSVSEGPLGIELEVPQRFCLEASDLLH